MRGSSIIPPGFNVTAHPIFKSWRPPEVQMFVVDEMEVDTPTQQDDSTTTHCPICISNFERPITVVGCNHSFCAVCIQIWFKTRLSCPLCASGTVHQGFVEALPASNDGRRLAWKLWSVGSAVAAAAGGGGGGGGSSILSLKHAVVQHAMRHHAALTGTGRSPGEASTSINANKTAREAPRID